MSSDRAEGFEYFNGLLLHEKLAIAQFAKKFHAFKNTRHTPIY
jgi:hypothetical protein